MKNLLIAGLAVLVATGTVSAGNAEVLLKSSTDIIGGPVTYPGGVPAEITGLMVTVEPGEANDWHSHPVPTFGYLLAGELTVQYASGEERVVTAGQSIIEAQHTPHRSYNSGKEPVKLLVFYAGAAGIENTVPGR